MKVWILSSICFLLFGSQISTAQAGIPEDLRGRLQLLDDVPSEWQGVWNVTSTAKDCETGFVWFSDTELDTLCAGSNIEPEDEDVNLTCVNTFNSTSYSSSCTGTVEDAGCLANYSYQSNITRSGETYSGTVTLNLTYTGVDCELASCIRIEITANRISNGSSVCLTPVEPWSWGTIKSIYPN